MNVNLKLIQLDADSIPILEASTLPGMVDTIQHFKKIFLALLSSIL